MPKLSKKSVERFTTSYNRLSSLGVTDEDLKYIIEVDPNRYRISFRVGNTRTTAFVRGTILDAIKKKWEMISDLSSKKTEMEVKEEEKLNKYQDITIKEGIELFMEYQKGLIGIDGGLTLSTYEKDMMVLQNRLIHDHPFLLEKVKNFDREKAQEYVQFLRKATHLSDPNKLLSENTIYNSFSFVRKTFRYFKEELQIVAENVFDKVTNKPKVVSYPKNYLVDDEIKLLLDKVCKRDIRLKLMVNLALELGIRIEELCGLKWKDYNAKRGSFVLDTALVQSKVTNEIYLKELKNSSSKREIKISETLKELINAYRKFKEACGICVNDSDCILTGWDGELIAPSRYTTIWKELLRNKCQIEDVPLKNARHSSATFYTTDNPNLNPVKNRFGHSKIETTLKFYSQASLHEDQKLVTKFDETFRNQLGFSLKDLYDICYNKYPHTKDLFDFVEYLTGKIVDGTNYSVEFERCQNYLLELFPVFSSIHQIDNNMNEKDIEKMLTGFEKDYRKIRIDPMPQPYIK